MTSRFPPRCCRPARLASLARISTLAAALALAGCFGPSEAELMASARTLMAKKDFGAAQLQLKTLLQNKPDAAEGRLLLGQSMLEAGNPAGAEAELRRALELGQSETAVLPPLAGALVSQGKGALLLQQFGQVTLAAPQADAELKTWLATAEAAEGQLPGAESRLALALRAAPEHTPALLLRARLAAAGGDAAGAMSQTQALLDRQPDNADAWLLKADLLMAAGAAKAAADPSEAIAAFRRALQLRPASVAAHSAIIGLQLGHGETAAATEQWAALQKVAPKHPQTLFYEAVLAEQKGDYKRGRELVQQLLRGSPDNVRLLMLAGQLELKLNALAQAEAHLAKAVQLAPAAAAPRRQLAQVQLRSGQTDKALLTLRPLLDSNPPDVEALTLSAQGLLMKGDSAGADANFARAAKLKPDDLRLRTALALSALAKGQDSASLAELRSISAADKGSTADMALISALVRRKDFAGALKAVDALAAKQPGEPLPDQLRGRIALQRQDQAGARALFEQALQKNADYLPALAALAQLDLADKQPAAAKARFEAVLQRNPKSTSAMLALAELEARSGGKLENSQAWLSKAIAAEPAEALPRQLMIDQQLATGQQRQALQTAQAAVAALPDNPELLDRLGRTLLLSGETQQAVSTFGKLATVAPRSALPQLRLADAHAAANNPSGMAAAVRRAAEIAPDQLQVRQAQWRLAMMENKPDQALAVARKLQAQRPDEAVGFGMEGELEMRRRNWDAASAAWRKALTRQQPGDAALRLHGSLVAGGKTAEADKLATDWRKSQPQDMAFVMQLGDLAITRGDAAKAELMYREVLERQPDQVLALNNLAYALATQKKPGAVALAEQALQRAPKAAAIMDTLAFSLAAEQKLDRAVEVQTQAVTLAPEAHQFRLHLAKLLLQSGKKTDARTELDKLAKLGKAFAQQDEVSALIKQTGG